MLKASSKVTNGLPHCCDCWGIELVVSTRMRNRRWKSRMKLMFMKIWWTMSPGMTPFCSSAFLRSWRFSRSWTYLRSVSTISLTM